MTVRSLFITVLLLLGVAVSASAQTRTIITSGTSTTGGNAKITIEDFDKPGRRDPIGPLSRPSAVYVVDVPVAAGWTCQQTTQAIGAALVAALPPEYLVQVFLNPCAVEITRSNGGGVSWNIVLEINIPGQTVRIEEGPIPVEPTTWGRIKARFTS